MTEKYTIDIREEKEKTITGRVVLKDCVDYKGDEENIPEFVEKWIKKKAEGIFYNGDNGAYYVAYFDAKPKIGNEGQVQEYKIFIELHKILPPA